MLRKKSFPFLSKKYLFTSLGLLTSFLAGYSVRSLINTESFDSVTLKPRLEVNQIDLVTRRGNELKFFEYPSTSGNFYSWEELERKREEDYRTSKKIKALEERTSRDIAVLEENLNFPQRN